MDKLDKLDKLVYYMDSYWDEVGDPRVNSWSLINGGIWKILSIMTAFLLITRVILPSYMRNRRPYELTGVMLFYNSTMVACNLVAFALAVEAMNWGKILVDFRYPSREDRSPKTMWYLQLGWIFFVTRLIDLLDTVWIVLRKKDSQITTLHLYHHTVVPFLCWISFKYNAMIPIIRLFVLLNTAIHTLMYGYYALAAFGPSVRPYLWWKRYITVFQILQFLICGTYGVILYLNQTDYPMDWFYFVVGQNPLFFYMFYDFYKQTYNRPKKLNKNN